MASAWNIVRAAGYSNVAENNENIGKHSPLPDKFKQRITVNSLRMSLRKRAPLKRLNGNNKRNKSKTLLMENSVKKTFYRVTEQLTGTSKRSQLKDTPQKSSLSMRYREKLRSPVTPVSSPNPFDSPCSSTPVAKSRRRKRTPRQVNAGSSQSRKTPTKKISPTLNLTDSDDFSHHLELVSCGIQQLEANGDSIKAAITSIGLDYLSSPLQPKIRGQPDLQCDGMRRYAPISGISPGTSTKLQNGSHAVPSTTGSKLRRTMTRMSLRVKNRTSGLRSTKSASNINPHCYVGPLGQKRKLPPLQPNGYTL